MGQTWNAATGGCDGSALTYTWQNALSQSENLTLSGHSDWRLPNRNELQSLMDYSRYSPTINTNYFPGTWSSYYWSSTTYAGNMNNAWHVNFHYGNGVSYFYKSSSHYVRAVRAGQSGRLLGDLVISQTPMSGPPGTTFTQRGTRFTHNGTATLHFRNQLGDELAPIQLSTDGLGAFEIVYNSPPDKPVGTHFWWAVDHATCERSGTLGYEITPSDVEETPLQEEPIPGNPPPPIVEYSFGTLNRVGEFDTTQDMFVIVHGWNTDDTDALPEWVVKMADTIKYDDASPAQGANVYTWNWQKEAKSDPLRCIP